MKTVYITESQIDKIENTVSKTGKWKGMLNEENGTVRKKVMKIIANNCSEHFCKPYLMLPLDEVPDYIHDMCNPFEEEQGSWIAVKNNQHGMNRFIDFLVLNLKAQVGISHGNGPEQYLPGIARILCADLGFYSFGEHINGGGIIRFSKLMKLIDKNPEFMLDGEQLDADLNGMTYEEIMEKFKDRINIYTHNVKNSLRGSIPNGDSEYTVVPINDTVNERGIAEPDEAGSELLERLDNYVDWCVCGYLGKWEYAQYLSNGGKLYIVMKNGYENIPKVQGENCPLDEYGLSLIAVIVGADGLPDSVTTRWNHEYGGENHSGLWNAEQLQKLTGLNYLSVFKPRNQRQLQQMHLAESVDGQSLEERSDTPSAQDQVHNKVNAGIMDAVTCGGMMEETIDENSNDRKVNKYISKKFGLTDFQDIRNKVMEIYEKIPYSRVNGGQYLLGVLRILFDENLPREDYSILNKILYKIAHSNYYEKEKANVLDSNFGGQSFDELKKNLFVPDFNVTDFSTSEKQIKVANGYTVTRIDSYDEMNAVCDGEWCISYDDSMWYDLIEDGTVYLVENEQLIDKYDREYEKNPEYWQDLGYMTDDEDEMMDKGYINDQYHWTHKPGDWEFPYDFYGMSRFVVVVYKDNFTCYSRWNMPNDFDGDYLTKQQIEKLLGVKFEDVFKPTNANKYNGWEYDKFGRRVPFGSAVQEGAEPESDEYTVGGEGGNNEYFHVTEGKKTVYITESQRAALKMLLENEGTNIKKARNYLKAKGYDEKRRQETLNAIRNDIPNVRLAQCKFLLGVTRMLLDGELGGSEMRKLNITLKYIASDAHVNEYDYNLNGESCQTLIERFSGVAKEDANNARAASDSRQLTPNENYTIVPIDNPKAAAKYGKYTTWCITHQANMYNSYTNEGSGRFYFCLANGFENVKAVKGANCPLDEYGLSMIAVSVDMDGSPNTITCRWNHDNGGNDNVMTVEELENVIGRNFYKTFVPYSREELRAKGFVPFEDVPGILADVFKKCRPIPEDFAIAKRLLARYKIGYYTFYGDYYKCVLNERMNLVKDGKLISKTWFGAIRHPANGCVEVTKVDGRSNIMDMNGNLRLDRWYDYLNGPTYGWYLVEADRKVNYVNKDNEFFFKNWYGYIGNKPDSDYFIVEVGADEKGYARFTIINRDEQPLINGYYNQIFDFNAGFAKVRLKDKDDPYNQRYNFIDKQGNLLSDTWFNDCDNFSDDNPEYPVVVRLNGKMNYLQRNGKLLLDQWYDYTASFNDDFGLVALFEVGIGNKFNYVDIRGNFLSKIWFSYAPVRFKGNGVEVMFNNRDWAILYPDGTIKVLNEEGDDYITVDNPEERFALRESKIGNFDFKKYFKPIADFMRKDGLNVYPYPKVKLDWSSQDGLFIKTGYYTPETKEITIFCDDRHPKDILRTFCHEMIHHSQNLDGVDLNFSSKDDVKDNERLEEIESEAYLKGNVYFRKWTEYQNKSKDLLQENIENEKWNGDGEEMNFDYPENVPKYLFHVSPIKNRESIKRLGLVPSVGEEYEEWWSYEGPNGEIDDNELPELVFMTSNPDTWVDRVGYGGYDLYRIDTDKLDKDDISYDPTPHLAEEGCYCYGQTVPPSALKLVKTFSDDSGDNDVIYEETEPDGCLIFESYKGINFGININIDETDWIRLILNHEKTIETRPMSVANTWRKHIGETIGLVRTTKSSKEPTGMLVGCATITDVVDYPDRKSFWADRDKHLVNGQYDPPRCGLVLANVKEIKPWVKLKPMGQQQVRPIEALRESVYDGMENIMEDVNPEDIDLSSFNIKTQLNPKFWKDGRLDSRIRMRLLDIADDFIEFLGVDWVKPDDVVITGSLANYNWNKNYSDIDLHVLIDYSKVDKRTDFVDNYFYSQKKLWNEEHKDLKIFGFPIEVFVQDTNAEHTSTGVYSLDKDKWIREPERSKLSTAKVNKSLIKNKVADYIDKIEKLLTIYKEAEGDYEVRKVSEKAKALFDKIKSERKGGLNGKDVEITNGNIIFKSLRRLGYIEKITNLMSDTYDKLNSLP